MTQPRKKQTKSSRKSGKSQTTHQPPDDFDWLMQQRHQPLPFSGWQFVVWCIIALDIIYCYDVANSYWQEAVVQQGHGRPYFVAGAFVQICLVQIIFITLYFIAKLLARFLRRPKNKK